jgi:hypothetical protein
MTLCATDGPRRTGGGFPAAVVARLAAHGFVLAVLGIGGVLVGFAVYKAGGFANQLLVQIPVAAAGVLGGFLGWYWYTSRAYPERLAFASWLEVCFAPDAAAAFGVVLFIPLHYLGRGYLTSFGNVIWFLVFLIPAATAATAAAFVIARRR